MATMMLMRDNHTVANELDLVRDHDLIKRVHQYGIMSPMDALRNNEDYAQYYTWEGNTTVQLDGWAWWTMAMVLRPHEAIEWRWGHETPVKYHGDMQGHPPMVPDTICNGVWEYAPDFKNDGSGGAGATVADITNKRRRPDGYGRRDGHHRLADEVSLRIRRGHPCRRRRRIRVRDRVHRPERLEDRLHTADGLGRVRREVPRPHSHG